MKYSLTSRSETESPVPKGACQKRHDSCARLGLGADHAGGASFDVSDDRRYFYPF
jgi:hypothetical protein